jgi:DNA replication protein DnaC
LNTRCRISVWFLCLRSLIGTQCDINNCYYRCDEFLTYVIDLKQCDYPKYECKIRKMLNFHLLIINNFLMNTITDERQVKVLLEVLEKRIELSRSTIFLQRKPDKCQEMIMNGAVSAT